MIEGKHIQQFIMRAITGTGERVTEKELTDQDFAALSFRVSQQVGTNLIFNPFMYHR